MDKELIERIALESGVWIAGMERDKFAEPAHTLERFASLIAEECAKVCDNLNRGDPPSFPDYEGGHWSGVEECADAIRARFELAD